MTPFELGVMFEGAQRNRSWAMETLAWLQSNIMNMLRDSKKSRRIKPGDLYRSPDAAPQFADEQSFREYMRAKQVD